MNFSSHYLSAPLYWKLPTIHHTPFLPSPQMKDLFLYSLSKSCSLVQSEVVSSSLVHLLSSLLGTMEQNHTHLGTGYQNHPLLSCLESLRVDLEETLTSYITETTIDQKVCACVCHVMGSP